MAAGTRLTGFLYATTPGLSAGSPGEHVLPQGDYGGALAVIPLAGPRDENRPVAVRSQSRSGTRAASFLNDWYNRLHIAPRVLDLGAAASGLARTTVLWNAYLSPSTLSTITEVGGDALTLGAPTTPKTYKPLEYSVLTVSPQDDGPATIDTDYTFSFPDRADSVTLNVVGRRARLWPFKPNWRTAVDVNLAYNTDVFKARMGREQRRSLRKIPRRTVEYAITVDGAGMRSLHRSMVQWQSRPWLLADPTRRVTCPAGAPMGSTQIGVESVPAWLVVGSTVVLGDDKVFLVTAVDADMKLVTFDAEMTAVVSAGTTLRPALSGLLRGDIRATHPTNGTAEFGINFEVQPGSEPEDTGSPGIYVHEGREILANRPNWGDTVESLFQWPTETVDYDFGRIATYSPQTFGTTVRRASYVSQTAEQASEIQQFFARHRGQRGEFLAPTWTDDLVPKVDLVEGTNVLRVRGSEVYDAYAEDTVYRAIAVILYDGRRLHRTVTSIETMADVDGIDSVLYLDGPWLSDVSTDEISMVCWMPVMRFTSDSLTVEWLTDSVAQTALSMQTLEYLEAEDPVFGGYDGAALWVIENWGFDAALLVFDPFDYLVNIHYASIFYIPEAWSWHNEDLVDGLGGVIDEYYEATT